MSTDHDDDPFGIRDPEDGDPEPWLPAVAGIVGILIALGTVIGLFWLLLQALVL